MQKDPNLQMILYKIIINSTILQSVLTACFISVLRGLYDCKETKLFRVILEALIYGSLSLCTTRIIDISVLPQSVAKTINSVIGFMRRLKRLQPEDQIIDNSSSQLLPHGLY